MLVLDDSTFIEATIRDFCSGGLFLELRQYRNIKNLWLQQKLQIKFSVGLEHGGEDFKLDVVIKRISPNGIGVAFENNATAAFEALKKQAQTTLGLTSADRRGDPNSLSKQKKLEADFVVLLEERLPAVIDSFFGCTKTNLTEAAERVENFEYNAALLDAITNLEINKDLLFEKFCSNAKQDVNLTYSPAPGNTAEDTNSETSLSLIDKNDFEDWLNLSAVIRKLNSAYESQLDGLQRKIAYVIGVDKNAIINPASPQKLCDCFRDSLIGIEENMRVKSTLYSVFENTLHRFLPDLYRQMDLLMMKYGAPVKIVDTTSWKKVTPGVNKSGSHQSPSEHASAIKAPSDHLLAAQQAVPSTQKSGPVIDVASNLMQLLQGRVFPQQIAKQTLPVHATEYTAEEIYNALTQLQKNAGRDSIPHHDIPMSQQQLLNLLNSVSNKQKSLASSTINSFEVNESLFKTLLNDMSLSSDIKTYLESIYLPIMAQALVDPGFFESDSHPARNIINHLAWLESAVKDHKVVRNTYVKQTLDDLVEHIAHESIHNPTIYAAVEQQLNELTQTVNKSIDHNIKRVTEVYEGRQKLEKARQSVHREINHCFAGKSIPKIIDALLEAGWQHLLVVAKLNEGSNAHSFQEYLSTVINLNNWLTGSVKATSEQARSALEFIDSQLQSVCTNTFTHQKILRELNALLLGDHSKLGTDQLEMVTIEPYEEGEMAGESKKRSDEIDQLRVGEWLTFLLNNVFEPLKLVWTGENQDLFVFVNRSGIKKLELEREELSELIRNGSANRIESLDVPIMDRATNKMLQQMHEKLVFNATHDSVTNLLNRKEFIKQLKLEQAKHDDVQHILCNIEILDFRVITNACGPAGGDALLRLLADLLRNHLREQEILGRLGDKSFSILLKNCSSSEIDAIAKKLQTQFINCHFEWQDKSYAVGVSIGMVPFVNGSDVNSLLQKADAAALSAKKAGRNRIQIYKEDDQSLQLQHNIHEWVGRIDQVFADDRLFIRCQKIAGIDPDKPGHTHYEILLGVLDENGVVIPPDNFVPAVERCQRMSEIDRWVIQTVFSWIEQHPSAFDELDGFSINLSGESLNSEEFLDFLKRTLAASKVPLDKITFEITETVAAQSFLFTQNFIKQIKRFNCKFSLDDFGSGYASYSYLKSLDIDYLKIDGAFVKDILNNKADVAIVKSINEVAKSLGFETIAEYVENDEILALLREIGVDYAQGWGIQKPIRLDDLG